MIYLLDTNTYIRHLNQRSPSITARLQKVEETDIAVCAIVKAELYAGAMKSQSPDITLAKHRAFTERFYSFPFDESAVLVYARIRSTLEQSGTPIGANDLLIAAIALANKLILITHNTREFGRITKLQLEDWETDQK
jgi:tRNA(fMet)-specific endonuclease VapC